MPFAAIVMAKVMLPKSSLAVSGGACRYLGHAHLYINGKSHKLELRSCRDYSANHAKSKSRHWLFFFTLGVYKHTCTYPHESDFKKPGGCCGKRVHDLKSIKIMLQILENMYYFKYGCI